MENQSPSNAGSVVYDVAVDESEARFESAGPLFQRHSVGLVGRLDHRWVDGYRKLTGEGSYFSGFHLEPAVARISFVCRKSDGPAAVAAMMAKLKELIERSNLAAPVPSRTPPRAATAPPEDDDKAAAGALFSRIIRGRSS